MIVSINQPAYLPYLGYFNRIAKSDLHVVLDHVQFEKNSFTNRNKIKTKDGSLMLTIPIKTKGQFGNLAINSIEIADEIWKIKHIKSLESTYTKAPYYKLYKDIISEFYNNDFKLFIDIVKPINDWLFNQLNIKTPLIYSSNLNLSSTKSDLILDICKATNASQYLSGPFGRSYLEIEKFSQNGIDVIFDDYIHPEYKQFNGNFDPYMCVFDLLFNIGPESDKLFINT